jgi:hypothetical protein
VKKNDPSKNCLGMDKNIKKFFPTYSEPVSRLKLSIFKLPDTTRNKDII